MADVLFLQPRLGDQAKQGYGVGERRSLREVGLLKPLLDHRPDVPNGGELEQAMSGERVSRPSQVQAELKSFFRRDPRDAFVGRTGLGRREPVLGGELLLQGHVGLDRRVWVELEAPEDDLHSFPVDELRQGLLEPLTPDVAPRAYDVGPNLDLHRRSKRPGSDNGARGVGEQSPRTYTDAWFAVPPGRCDSIGLGGMVATVTSTGMWACSNRTPIGQVFSVRRRTVSASSFDALVSTSSFP